MEPSVPPASTLPREAGLSVEPSVPPASTLPGEAGLSVEPSVPPASTLPHGAQMEKLWGKRWGSVWNPLFHQSTQYHMVLRWKTHEERSRARSGNPLFHQLTQYHMVLRWKILEERGRLSVEPSIPPVNTVPHGAQMENSVWLLIFFFLSLYFIIIM